MSNNVKHLLIIWGLAIVASIGVGLYINNAVNAEVQPPQPQCPTGSYFIGVGPDGLVACHLNPTGCPYGDSIPMDQCVDKSSKVPVTNTPAPVVPDGPAYDSPAYIQQVQAMAK